MCLYFIQNVEKRRPSPLSIFSTKLLQLNQSRKLKVQTTRKTNGNADGAQKNLMMRAKTNRFFVITVVISITCNARLQYEEDKYCDTDIESEEFHCDECEP